MAKDDRSAINPFTGKKHLDLINDDKFLQECYKQYRSMLIKSQLLDNTIEGQLVNRVASRLIATVENYLKRIGRYDYVEDYYDWEVHLVASDVANAFCMPGGKIVIYSGILKIANSEEALAFIMGHEMSHALLDHSRTQASERQRKNTLTSLARIGGLGLALFGFGELADLTYAATNVADLSSEFLLLQPHGREQELEADRLGTTLIHLAGYNIEGIPDFWRRMSAQNSNNFDFFSTHPADDKRIAAMSEVIDLVENQADFYSAPILSDEFKNSANSSKNKQRATNQINRNQQIVANQINRNQEVTSRQLGVYKISDRKICSNCGKTIDTNANFCTNCGTPLTDKYSCSNCGARSGENDKFCTNCGSRFSN